MEKHDVILLITTDASLNKFPHDFVNQLYDSYFNTNYSTKKRAQKISATIKSTPEWLDKIKQQAINEKITLDKAIENNVEYILKEEAKKDR